MLGGCRGCQEGVRAARRLEGLQRGCWGLGADRTL